MLEKLNPSQKYNENKVSVWLSADEYTEAKKAKRENGNNPQAYAASLGEIGNRGGATSRIGCRRYELIIWFCAHNFMWWCEVA